MQKTAVLKPNLSCHAEKVLSALRKAVRNELERKRRLGHYAVIWDGKKPVLRGDDAPVSKE